jgi:hypothetical protein
MYVPPLQIGNGTEVGHKHFQHPDRNLKDFGPTMDRFSFIVVDVSLHALMVDPTLYTRFGEGGETIIFKANDYVDPSGSEVFRILKSKPELHEATNNLERVCGATISQVPTLEDFLAGKNIPTAKVRPVRSPGQVTPIRAYIGAFAVLSASDFAGVMRNVGNKIELVGQIQTVKHGVGKKGRGKDKPYTFINFGPWLGNIVKLTIWSEGLTNMTNRPSEAWVGRWVSVTGLVDPPYRGKHWSSTYTHVGITLTGDGQVQFISETEAQYRLGLTGKSGKSGKAATTNQAILQGIGQKPTVTSTQRTAGPQVGSGAQSTQPSNQAILNAIKQAPGTPAPYHTPASMPPLKGKAAAIPGWLWVVGIIIFLYFISHLGR